MGRLALTNKHVNPFQTEHKFIVQHGDIAIGTIRMIGLTRVTLTNLVEPPNYAVTIIGNEDIVVRTL